MEHEPLTYIKYAGCPGELTFILKGPLNAQAEACLSQIITEILPGARNPVELDLKGVTGIDASGLAQFTLLVSALVRQGRQVRFTGLSPELAHAFALAAIDPRLPGFSNAFDTSNGHTPQTPITQWAQPVTDPTYGTFHPDATNLNVDGRFPSSPLRGFGGLRLRTYRVALTGVTLTPVEIIAQWKQHFAAFWPPGNTIYSSTGSMSPGSIALLNLTIPPGLKLATGALVMYSSDDSFSFLTLQGHMFSGFIIFSSYLEEGVLYAQTQALVRTHDLIYELSFLLKFGAKAEDAFWHKSLVNLAAHFGVEGAVHQTNRMIDPRFQWRYFGNIWHNASIRSGIHQALHPFAGRRKDTDNSGKG